MNINALLELDKRMLDAADVANEVAKKETKAGRTDAALIAIHAFLTLVQLELELADILDGIEESVELEKN